MLTRFRLIAKISRTDNVLISSIVSTYYSEEAQKSRARDSVLGRGGRALSLIGDDRSSEFDSSQIATAKQSAKPRSGTGANFSNSGARTSLKRNVLSSVSRVCIQRVGSLAKARLSGEQKKEKKSTQLSKSRVCKLFSNKNAKRLGSVAARSMHHFRLVNHSRVFTSICA